MRVVILTETFAKNMGYIGSMLPKYLARLGVDVHVITMDLLPYYKMKDFKKTYESFLDSTALCHGMIEDFDGYTLHVLSHRRLLGYMRMVGLRSKLWSLRPDIVQSTAAVGWIPLDAAMNKPFLRYKLFTGNHNTFSTFLLAEEQRPVWSRERLKCFVTRTIPGRLVSLATEKCYGVTKDCAEIACRYYGVQQHKAEVMHLGVDRDFFFPVISEDLAKKRTALRICLGFSENDIVCIYTGKLIESKNALILAKAIEHLRSMGEPFRGLFIGGGPQKESILAHPSSVVLDFMPFSELGAYYRAADIGVWPTNESTSMLDAAACGLPLIVSDGIVYREHVEGNGIVYKMNDLNDLVYSLLRLRDLQERKRLGFFGADKMARDFSWESVARRRLVDYEAALGSGKNKR
jgi:glycosyltransferase involved in cell wall biosynthesis